MDLCRIQAPTPVTDVRFLKVLGVVIGKRHFVMSSELREQFRWRKSLGWEAHTLTTQGRREDVKNQCRQTPATEA